MCVWAHPACAALGSASAITLQRKKIETRVLSYLLPSERPLKKVSLDCYDYLFFVILLAYSAPVRPKEIQVCYQKKELSEHGAQPTDR